MNLLYICPNFPPNYFNFCVRLKEAGVTVVGVGWEDYARLRPELKEALTEYCRVENMGNYEHVLKAAGYLLSRVGRLDRIAAMEEHWIDLAAALRLDFNVPGPKPSEIKPLRYKSLMKEVFRGVGITVAEGELASDPARARAFAERVGYPLIAKPDKGVGAHATFKLAADIELDGFFQLKDPAVTYILESFLPGRIESFDGLVDRNGTIVFCTAHRYGNDIMTVVNTDDHVHYWSLREIPADLEDLGRQAVAAFGLRERFFHMEFMRDPEGELSAMEINARPPGGLTTDMFNYANDIDVYREWANVIADKGAGVPTQRPYHVCYIGRKNNKRYVHAHDEILSRWGAVILTHTPIDPVFARAIGDYGYLARAPRLEDLWPVVEFIHLQA